MYEKLHPGFQELLIKKAKATDNEAIFSALKVEGNTATK